MTILVLGSRGLVGSAICRELTKQKLDFIATSRATLDVTNRSQVHDFFRRVKPSVVFAAAARVGGLLANSRYPVEFLSENVLSQTFLMEAAHLHGTEKFIFLGSSCIYPRDASQPITENSLLTGPLEQTNEAYAIAKIAGVKLIQGYRREYGKKWISVMPTNLYGINDNFDLNTSHVVPALLRKMHDAKETRANLIELWGTGSPRREFMFADDLAAALVFLMFNYDSDEPINVGTGVDVSILELSEEIRKVVDYKGEIVWNTSVPDGTPRKLLDVSKLTNLGWRSTTKLESGIQKTYRWFNENYEKSRLTVEPNGNVI